MRYQYIVYIYDCTLSRRPVSLQDGVLRWILRQCESSIRVLPGALRATVIQAGRPTHLPSTSIVIPPLPFRRRRPYTFQPCDDRTLTDADPRDLCHRPSSTTAVNIAKHSLGGPSPPSRLGSTKLSTPSSCAVTGKPLHHCRLHNSEQGPAPPCRRRAESASSSWRQWASPS